MNKNKKQNKNKNTDEQHHQQKKRNLMEIKLQGMNQVKAADRESNSEKREGLMPHDQRIK